MRVVMLTTFHERCGIATYSEVLVRELRALGVDVRVLAPHLRDGEPSWGEQPERLWRRNRAFGLEGAKVYRALAALDPDVVHAQINLSLFSSRVLLVIAEACRLAGIPLVATLHGRRDGSWGRNFKLWRFLVALRHADVVVHTEAHRLELHRERVHVIPHGIHPIARRDRDRARASLGLDPARPVLAHFGFLTPDKGIAHVLHAVAKLARAELPDLCYWVCGAVYGSRESRAHFAELRALVARLGVERNVHMTGEFVHDDRAVLELQAADWVVLNYATGTGQGASGAVRRALSSGTPVAVSSAPVFEDVRDGAFVLDPPLAAGLLRILRDPDLGARVSQRARDLCERHGWSHVARAHVDLYESARRGDGA
jgi:glycosyltransferase involved in cell wall biosynthesis